ncbi:hypothetical protein [Desulfofustis phage LS06-2018-MD01]|nr:hypothetical protein [Desulfofustis phage LS06-2018-MD01]
MLGYNIPPPYLNLLGILSHYEYYPTRDIIHYDYIVLCPKENMGKVPQKTEKT